jgi:lambda family phage portal protein
MELNPLKWFRAGGKPASAPRRMVRQQSAGFAGAAVNRLTQSLATWSGSANSDAENGLAILRARARALCNNHEYARRFLSLTATHIVGADGPTLQVRALTNAGLLDSVANSAVEMAWWKWQKTADIGGRMTFAHLLRVTIKAVARDGEALVRIVRRRDLPNGFALQLLEIDRLDETLNKVTPDGLNIRMGVEIDSMSRPIAYHVKTSHPGESWGWTMPGYERIPADQIWHVFLPERAEQVRGYSWLHAVLIRMGMLHSYEEAAVVAARVGASKMGFFKRAAEDGGYAGQATGQLADQNIAGSLSAQVEPGEMWELPPGYDFESFNPDYPHANFESFMKGCLRGIAAGLDIDYATLANDLEAVNYSSMRAGTIETRDQWQVLQGWFIDSLVMPIYREWLASALVRGDIRLPASGRALPADRFAKFSDASTFLGRRWQWVDPLKDAEAEKALLAAGLTSRGRIAAKTGQDFDEILAELADEQAKIAAAGVVLGDQPVQVEVEDSPEDEAEDEAEDETDNGQEPRT